MKKRVNLTMVEEIEQMFPKGCKLGYKGRVGDLCFYRYDIYHKDHLLGVWFPGAVGIELCPVDQCNSPLIHDFK